MTTKLSLKQTMPKKRVQLEYELILDGVVALPVGVFEKPFFDGLLDAALAHVEKYQGQAAISMKHKPYIAEAEIETSC